ncbi:glycosyltransferase family 2 protein [Alloyangia pacifica]|uniref:glycosyltransferase family 2 protein n=1 Tax=Alloyangia pacifica TaxID=311180 RepID=UPI001CFEB65C|nr:glycosyltransferase family 2 protein [Alloyangia pacifica]
MPRASIIVTASNAADRLQDTLRSLCAQSFPDFEILVVDDGSTDDSAELAEAFGDLRIRVLRQRTRGTAGARNTGIAAARGCFVGFCDAGDCWAPTKLAEHVAQFQASPAVGLSYSGSEALGPNGRRAALWKTPRKRGIGAAEIFKRNPVGPASAAMIRRAALDSVAFRPPHESERDWWFDETFRQVETLELWLRFALVSDWEIVGIPSRLCSCCSAETTVPPVSVGKQIAAWERMVTKLSAQDRHFFGRHAAAARAYHLRHLARCAILAGEAPRAAQLLRAALASSLRPLAEEPRKTLAICASGLVLYLSRLPLFARLPGARGRSA